MPSDPTGIATHKNIYKSCDGGNYIFIGSIPNSESTFVDNCSNLKCGNLYPVPIPDLPKSEIVKFGKNIRIPINEDIIKWSIGDDYNIACLGVSGRVYYWHYNTNKIPYR